MEKSKEFAFNRQDFDKVRTLIYQRAGIALADGKQEMVYSRLARRLRATGAQSFTDYLSSLERGTDPAEWEAFTNSLTTNLTSFFREQHHFPVLAAHARTHKECVVWCAASSTGEEPYSIAMTLCEAFDSLTPPVQIMATDIDTEVLATAQLGVYPEERIRSLSAEQRRRFFLKGKASQSGLVRVRPELRKLVTFGALNLLSQDWPLRGPFDVIFCRNVMIYFDKPTQRKILSRFVTLMKPDGLLFAGHSENFLYVSHDLRLRGKTVYELLHQPAPR
jgi:chemotaxis protein methyltransferase CheR